MLTLAHGAVGDDLAVVVSSREAPSDDDWDDQARWLEDLVRPLRAARRPIKVLVFTDEAGPNAKQRASVVDVMKGVETRVAVVSNGVLVRNMITAFGWLSFPIKGFAPAQLSTVEPYLEISSAQLQEALGLAAMLAPRVGGSHCVELAVAARKSAGRVR